MLRTAMSQLRLRPLSFLGLATALFMAVTALTMFGLLLVAGLSGPSPTGDQPGLVLLGGVFGEIVVLISLFVVVNTLGFAVRQQHRDLALLRTIAATPAQVRRLVRWQVLLVTLACSPPGWIAGATGAQWFLHAVIVRDLAPAGDTVLANPLPMLVATGLTTVIGTLSAAAATRRVSKLPPAAAIVESLSATSRVGLPRVLAGLVTLGGGIAFCVIIASATPQRAADGALLDALILMVAVAFLGPLLARLIVVLLGAPVRRLSPESGWLADANLRGYALRLSSAVIPLALLVGLSCTFMFIGDTIRDAAQQLSSTNLKTVNSPSDRWLRGIEMAILVCFGGVSTVNTLAALTAERRREFALLSLIGATHRQLAKMLVIETFLITIAGVALGTLIAGSTSIAFSETLPGAPLPSTSVGGYLLIALGAAALGALGSFPAALWAASGSPTGLVAGQSG